ncbi:two-component response regulator-like APRR7 isoform X2 [Physcomitrium patens]|uniref:Uncharacterized protein n=2 Tax=Physcomitrium patens TaxID=3218 RepID=A0A7I4F6R5_PHYPA|nr:two-component response regulator-like PRR37 isoform X2 [Physcomitrium patens]|eukprot:XP_024398057.1 two-component response regulator-like PRR37 isoform X2 [Physcomitrella patens]
MTADLSEVESESRPLRPFSGGGTAWVESNVGIPEGPEWRIKDGFKTQKEVDRGREQVGVNRVVVREKNGARLENGRRITDRSGTAVLKAREGPKDIAEQRMRKLDHQFPANDLLGTSESDEDGRREDSAEDHYEEGDAVAAVACEKQRLLGIAQTREQQHGTDVAAGIQGGDSWESFLLKRKLRVLLVEDDDATRHVVGALLRNCNYEVTSVANGSLAWGLLEEANSNFDLVLTDVVMPCLSGVGILSKMLKREACKRVPIVIMSSYDSLNIVFRCLSKGACDYLVKPVRKNELKNLWQHVWRKCHSGSSIGSRSGSGNQTGEVARPQSRGVEAADNPIGSNDGNGSSDGSDNGSSRLNAQGGSDNGSGNQACVQPVQVPRNNAVPEAADGDEEGQATSQDKGAELDEEMGHDLEMATRPSACNTTGKDQQPEVARQLDEDAACVFQDAGQSPDGINGESPSSSLRNDAAEESSPKAIDLINVVACQPQTQDAEQPQESENDFDELDPQGSSPKVNSGSDSGPMLELSLKRPRSAVDNDGELEERQPLRYSGGSAFSRYDSGGTIIQQHYQGGSSLPLNGYPMCGAYGVYGMPGGGSGGSLRLGMGMDRIGSSKESVKGLTSPLSHPQNVEKAGGQDGCSSATQTTEDALIVPGMPMAIPIPPPGMLAYDGVGGSYGPAMHPMYYAHPSARIAAPPPHMGERGEVYNQSPAFKEQDSGSGHHSQAGQSHQHMHHHQGNHHHHHHHYHHGNGAQHSGNAGVQDEQQQSVVTLGSGAPRCGSTGMDGQSGSSNGYGSTGNGNGSMNGSASGSNTGVNNGQSGLGAMLMANDNSGSNGAGGTDPSVDGVSGGNGLCTDQMRFARREAALNKFRQKRKERCFEKKVRYQSRKRLAEQRPRVRGQFVRQAVYDPSAVTSRSFQLALVSNI